MIEQRSKGVGDVLGAIMVLIIIFAASMVLLLAVGHLYVAVQDYHNAQVLTSMEDKENMTAVYMQSVPPSGSPGIVVTNYGISTNITSMIEIGPGGVSYTPENIYLQSGASIPIMESSQAAGVTTSYGGVFYTNYTSASPGMVPVSIFGEGVSIQSPYGSGLWYVPDGTNVNIHSSGKATWYVNGTVTSPSGISSSSITVDGPTTVTAVEDFYVSVSASPSGAGTLSPASGWYPLGSQITFSESPNSGSGYRYIFSGWSGTLSSSSTSFTEGVYSDITEVANYNEQFYVSVSSPNGWGNPQGAGWYNAGSTATVSVTSPYSAGSGSRVVFSTWSGTLGSNSNPFSFTVNSPTSENVNWVQQYQVSISASPSGGASSLSPSSGWYDSGVQVTFSETPDTGSGYQYVFQSWTGTYSSASASFSETVSQPITETANYQLQYYLTMNSDPSGGGPVSPSSGWYNSGAQVSISASASSGWQFNSWSGSGPGSYSGSTSSVSITMNGPVTETANFYAGITFSQSGLSSGASGTVLTVGSSTYSYSALPLTLYLAPGGQLSFTWSSPVSGGSGIQFTWRSTSGLSTSQSATITVSGPGSMAATYGAQYYLTMEASPSSEGSVSPGSGWYNSGAPVAISETPASGYTFAGWAGTGSGSYSGTTGSTSITMNAPVTETADFQLPQYSYTFNENGLPIGTTWSVTLGNSTKGGMVGGKSGGSPSYSGYYYSESGSSFSLSVTKGQAIIAIYGDYHNDVRLASISDSQGNTWVPISNQNSLGIYAAIASASGTDTISYTAASGASWWGLYVMVVNNIVITNPTVISGSGTSVSSFTPPTGSFVLSAGWVETSSDYPSASPGSGFTQPPSIIAWFLQIGPTYGLYAEYANAWSGGSTTASWSTSTITSAYTTAIVFSPVPSSPSVTSVTFNGITSSAEAWSASASNGWSFWTPTGEVTGPGSQTLYGAIPITVNNAQTSATPAPFQQLIQFNPSSYLISDLGAIRFYTASGTPLYGWLESGTASSTASAWVKLPNGVGASSSIQLMMTANSSGFDGNYWGEAPQMSDPFSVTAWRYGGTPPSPSGNGEPSGVTNVGTGYFPSAYSYSTDAWGDYAGNTYLGMPTQPFPPPFSFINSYPPSGTSYGYTATGSFTVPATGSYTFEMETDDGMEVLVSGPGLSGWVPVVSSWHGQGATEYTGSANLQAGGTYQIAIDYFNSGGPGVSAFTVTPSVNWIGSYGQYDNGQNVFNYYWNFASYPGNWGGAPSTLITYDGYTIWGSSTPAGSQTNFNVGSTGVTLDWYGYLSEPTGAGYWDSPGLWGGQYPSWFTWQGQGNYGYGVQNPGISVYYTSASVASPEVFSVGYTSSTIYYYLNYVQQPTTISYTGGSGWIGFRNGAGGGGGGGSDVFVQWVDVRATPPNGVMPTVTIL